MNLEAKFGWKAGQPLGIFLLILTCALSVSARNNSQAQAADADGTPLQSDAIPAPGISGPSAPNGPLEVTHYIVNFEGDHSLDVTTAVEKNSSGYSRYSVQLRSDSGAVQVFEVAAPPGGLQVEMRDMDRK